MRIFLSLLFAAYEPAPSVPAYTKSALPTPNGSSYIARVTDTTRGLVYSDGSQQIFVDSGAVDVTRFNGCHATTDGSVDCLPAFNAAILAMGAAESTPSASDLVVPKPTTDTAYYYLSGPLHITRQLHLRGLGGRTANQFGTGVRLVWPAGSDGIIVDFSDGSTRDGNGAMISNLSLTSSRVPTWAPSTSYTAGSMVIGRYRTGYIYTSGSGTHTSGSSEPNWSTVIGGTTSDGGVTWTTGVSSALDLKAAATIEHCGIYEWSGNGIHVEANSGGSPPSNANDFVLTDTTIQYVAGSGLFTSGTDANAGFVGYNIFDSNDVYGIDEDSSLGSEYIANEISSNGSLYGAGGLGPWFMSTSYPANSFTFPNTRNGYYFQSSGGTSGGTEPTWCSSVGCTVGDNGITWTAYAIYNGGSVHFGRYGNSNSSNGDGNYVEGSSMPIQLGLYTRWNGGIDGAGVDVNSTGHFEADNYSTGVNFYPLGGGPLFSIATNTSYPLFFDSSNVGTTNEYSLGYTSGEWYLRNQNLDANAAIGFTTPAFNIHAGGTPGKVGATAFGPNGFYLGSDTRWFPTNDVPGSSGFQYGDVGLRNLYQATTVDADGGEGWLNIAGSGATAYWARFMEWKRHRLDKTTDYSINMEDAQAYFTDFGSSGTVKFTLPAQGQRGQGIKGWWCDFVVRSNGIKITDPVGNNKIRFGSGVTANNGYLQSTTIGSTLRMTFVGWDDEPASNNGTWEASAVQGPWIFDGTVQSFTEALLATTTVDMSIGTKQTLYTVPPSVHLVPTKFILRNASAAFVAGSVGFGFDAGATNVAASSTYTGLSSSAVAVIVPPTSTGYTIGAAAVLGAEASVTQAATTVVVDTYGYLY